MAWYWRCESATGDTLEVTDIEVGERFPTQSDAESWVGELWQDLLGAGVAQVTLFEDGREVYGPMSLSPTQ